jgi:hypothetical protein
MSTVYLLGTKRGDDERPYALERRIDAGVGPLGRVDRVVEARPRIEYGAAGQCRVHIRELASLDARDRVRSSQLIPGGVGVKPVIDNIISWLESLFPQRRVRFSRAMLSRMW